MSNDRLMQKHNLTCPLKEYSSIDIDHFRITAIWPGDRIRQPEQPTENEVRRHSCDESV